MTRWGWLLAWEATAGVSWKEREWVCRGRAAESTGVDRPEQEGGVR